MHQEWVSLAESPTVEILLSVVADLQQRVLDLEADMVTLRSQCDDREPWPIGVTASADFWKTT